jgi:hypothetical protein
MLGINVCSIDHLARVLARLGRRSIADMKLAAAMIVPRQTQSTARAEKVCQVSKENACCTMTIKLMVMEANISAKSSVSAR